MLKRESHDKHVLKALFSINRKLERQNQLLEAIAMSFVGQDEAVKAIFDSLSGTDQRDKQSRVLERGHSLEDRLLEELRRGEAHDAHKLPQREDE